MTRVRPPIVLMIALSMALAASAQATPHDAKDKKEKARSSSTEMSRHTASPEHGRSAVFNTAPAGQNELDRSLQTSLDGILGSKWLKSAINGVYVVDVQTGRVLYSYGEDRQLNPASNTKLVSTATALDLLGPDFT